MSYKTFGLLLASLCGGCSSGGIFNYSIPTDASDGQGPSKAFDLSSLGGISTAAKASKENLIQRANDNANSVQVFEATAIGGAMGTAGAAVFHAATREIEALALGTGALTAFGQYYAPRTRAAVYMNGAAAMNCIGTLADQSIKTIFLRNGDGSEYSDSYVATANYLADPNSKATQTQLQYLHVVVDLPFHALRGLSDSFVAIDSAVLNQSLSKSSSPNIQQLQDQLTTQIQQAASVKTALNGTATDIGGTPKQPQPPPAPAAPAPMPAPPPPPPPGAKAADLQEYQAGLLAYAAKQKKHQADEEASRSYPSKLAAFRRASADYQSKKHAAEEVAAQIQYMIDFAADFDTQLTKCTGLAGSSS